MLARTAFAYSNQRASLVVQLQRQPQQQQQQQQSSKRCSGDQDCALSLSLSLSLSLQEVKHVKTVPDQCPMDTENHVLSFQYFPQH
uniref:Uncharacterized protein n=1 Tax=Physcomitrium patens TaxID=3218 RepID=A0A2K1L717_PHYPA|nr:hypothetical protein PHYPA_000226 [Physcomitrium patens]